MPKDEQDIKKNVMNRIKKGDVKMKPKIYFVVLGTTAFISTVLTTFFTAYLMSLTFFWVKVQTANSMAYGARRNLAEIISSFPWWALISSGILFIFIYWLIKNHGTAYHRSASSVVLIILTISLCLGVVFSVVGLGENRYPRGDEGWRGGRSYKQL